MCDKGKPATVTVQGRESQQGQVLLEGGGGMVS